MQHEGLPLDAARGAALRPARLKSHAGRKSGGQVGEALPRPRSHNQGGCKRNLGGAAPLMQGEKGIRAHKAEKRCARRQVRRGREQRLKGIIGLAGRIRRIDFRNLEARSPKMASFRHPQSIFKRGRRALAL